MPSSAAVATAAVLNLVEPMNVGIGGDMFAIIYSAKDKKLYQLNAGGMAPTGATVDHYNSLGYKYDPNNWGYGSGIAARRNPVRTRSQRCLGLGMRRSISSAR